MQLGGAAWDFSHFPRLMLPLPLYSQYFLFLLLYQTRGDYSTFLICYTSLGQLVGFVNSIGRKEIFLLPIF